jgi:uncharacterized damage-inducible protein DinB
MTGISESERAAALVAQLRDATARILAVLETIDDDRWSAVRTPGVWSIGKEAAHIAEAAVYHQWIVRLTIGEKVSSRRPRIERSEMTTDLSRPETIGLIRQRSADGIQLLGALTDAQLDTPTRPPRHGGRELLAVTIERVLIDHYAGHRTEIEAKLNA